MFNKLLINLGTLYHVILIILIVNLDLELKQIKFQIYVFITYSNTNCILFDCNETFPDTHYKINKYE